MGRYRPFIEIVLILATLLGCAQVPPQEETQCTIPQGMVLVPAEVAAKAMLDINSLDEELIVCKAAEQKWRKRGECS